MVFRRLYRVQDENVHNEKGYGLGLHYVKQIVEAHGGTITLSSELNKGSRFNVYLPFSSENITDHDNID
jgi:signal transduction histidine kinase